MKNNSMEKVYNHLDTEENWYDKWVESGLFRGDEKSDKTSFSMILPPANVTGSLHMGHALAFSIPDIINRRKIMQGYNCLWLPGVDHAGIATQMVVERELKREQNKSKEDLGREKFLDLVWDWKEKSEKRICEQLKKLGLSLDWSRMKFTLSPEMQEVVTKVFVQLYKEGKIYPGDYMVNRCPSCKTVLSDLEVTHKELSGTLSYIKYPVVGSDDFVTIATTRVETLLGDVAVAVHPDDEKYKKYIGKELILPLCDRKIPLIADEMVDKDFGTGAVKITPAHDFNDYETSQRHNLPIMEVIDKEAKICGNVPSKYLGLSREECREILSQDLKEADYLIKVEDYTHNVGHCQRCESVVEPNFSKQWFLKTKEMAKEAIDKVEDNSIDFIPDNWKKVYFNWMNNIQDWCISRQLWWGHRIPAWYCQECKAITVENTDVKACSSCGSQNIKQDEDVLDTWFSSALWPFSTLGWANESQDFKIWYPTSIMATGFDIIFFWVARMIMMGLHFTQDIPFRDILINGLIRDEKGQKMSKTKNNVVDPLDIIKDYGADALRFTLAVQAVPGMDISLSLNRIKGYRAFANKIWNASRYVIMNLKGDEEENIDFETITSCDKWILASLNNLVEELNELMDKYKINEAADRLYHFFWHQYCDWYLEFSKVDRDNKGSRTVLKYTLLNLIKLLHPFMPYITEEIYQKIKTKDNFLLENIFPEGNGKFHFAQDYQLLEFLKNLVSETRKIKSENKIDPSKKINVILRKNQGSPYELKEIIKYYNLMTRSQETLIINEGQELDKGFKGVVSGWEIVIPFDSEEDRIFELNRLKKEEEKNLKFIESIEVKLSNKKFVENAPEKVVVSFRCSLSEAKEKADKLKKTIEDLS